ncbi:MAG: thioredoxin [Leptospiraceae bacterium]|nr:thioredoxin [Leptospiraceae bacterium]
MIFLWPIYDYYNSMPIEVNELNFKEMVLEKSESTPVLLDFWAEWCAPCRMLSPVLDKVEKDFQGSFALAKLNTDENPNISMQYRISGIPAVKLFINAEVVDEFTGALPEKQVVAFLKKHIISKEEQRLLELKNKNPELAAETVINENFHSEMAYHILWEAALSFLKSGKEIEKIKKYLTNIPELGTKHSDKRSSVLRFLDSEHSREDLIQISNLFLPDKKKTALDYFLQKVENSKSQEEKIKNKEPLLSCFYLIGATDEELVNEYRRKLSFLLY